MKINPVHIIVYLLFATLLHASHAAEGDGWPLGQKANSIGYNHLGPNDVPAAAQEQIQKCLARDLYAIKSSGSKKPDGQACAYEAYNGNQDLRAYFASQSVHILPADLKNQDWYLELTFSGYGRPGSMISAPQVCAEGIEVTGQRLAYKRGMLTEWYVNDEQGLEQGVTLGKAPCIGKTGSVAVEWTVSGSLTPFIGNEGETLTFCGKEGDPVLAYAGLYAHDRKGTPLPARLELAGSKLRIVVDDRNACYPVTIDPWIQQARLTASDGVMKDRFGWSCAVSGDTVVAGAYAKDYLIGAVYVFEKPAGGWTDMTESAKLSVTDSAWGDSFGHTVAIHNDVVVVGAYYKTGPGYSSGAAYVFEKPAGGWADMTESAKLLSSDLEPYDELGYSVAISNDTVVVGAMGENNAQGSAYVFVKPGSEWSGIMLESAKLIAGDGDYDERFGSSVSIDGDTIAVGALGDDIGANTWQGSVYIFEKPGAAWVNMAHTVKLTATDGAALDSLGKSVGICEDTVVAGAWGADDYYGTAYVFEKPAGGWVDTTETAKLSVSVGNPVMEFGISVAISNDRIVVGADPDDENGPCGGAAYIFDMPAGGWTDMTETEKLISLDGLAHDWFGYSVSISGDTVICGAYGKNIVGMETGAVYVFEQPPSDPLPDIKANSSDGPIVIPQGTNLIIDIALDPGIEMGTDSDWWVALVSPFGVMYYSLAAMYYVPGFAVTYQGPLFTLDPIPLFMISSLPPATYTFYFGVDTNMNGIPDMDELYVDLVEVTVE
jgi:hypothetical protein